MDNKCISCSVDSCKFHSDNNSLCTLSSINVGRDENECKGPHCTCCNSYVEKDRNLKD